MAEIESYANRLRKNARHWGKWARRQGISCYRIYDQDIPEFPVAVDRYGDQVHLQEYQSRWEAMEAEHKAWWQAVMETTAQVLELPITAIHGKLRKRQQGEEQYEKTGERGRDMVVEEGGHDELIHRGGLYQKLYQHS